MLVDINRYECAVDAGAAAAEDAGVWLALRAAAGPVSVALPGGRSPAAFLAALATTPVPWHRVVMTPTDERRVAADHALSNERALRAAFAGTPAEGARLITLDGPGAAARIRAPFDLVVLGMGADGHIASLFPGEPLGQPGEPAVIAASPWPLPAEAPVARWSWSLTALASAHRVLLLIAGPAKREVLERALHKATDLPIGAFLRRTKSPVTIYWSEVAA